MRVASDTGEATPSLSKGGTMEASQTLFAPQAELDANDGGDRWLPRIMICSSLPRFRSYGQLII